MKRALQSEANSWFWVATGVCHSCTFVSAAAVYYNDRLDCIMEDCAERSTQLESSHVQNIQLLAVLCESQRTLQSSERG